MVWLQPQLSLQAVLLLPRRITNHVWRWFNLVQLLARMLNTFKQRHLQHITKSLRYRRVLVLYGRQGYGIGRVAVMCGALESGHVHQQVTTLGTVVDGTTRRVAAGTTAVDTGAKK